MPAKTSPSSRCAANISFGLIRRTGRFVVYTTKRPVMLVKAKEILAAHLDEGEVFAGVAR